jgi:hypothetical protein
MTTNQSGECKAAPLGALDGVVVEAALAVAARGGKSGWKSS